MKRILLCFGTMFLVLYLFTFTSHAESNVAPNGNSYQYKYQVSWYRSRYYYLYSNIPFGRYTGNSPNSYGQYNIGVVYNDVLYFDCDISMSNYVTISTGYQKYPTQTSSNVVLPESVACIYDQNGNVPNNSDNLWAIDVDMPISGITYQQLYENLKAASIDYDTVYYSPLIPNVDFSVVLNTSGVPVNDINSTEYNAFNVNINSDVGTDYKIQIGYKAHVPNKMALGVNSNGTSYYSALTYNSANYQDIYSLQDDQVAFTGSVNSSLFSWTRQAVSTENWNVVSSLQGNTSFINGSISAYNDTMSYIMPLYGKKLEIFMRYYIVQDGQIIVGAWSHWNNSYPTQYTQELPSNYIPYHDVPGYEQTSSNTEYQENTNTISSLGTETGNSNNISIYNNSVPNYPNYPTISSYNHDNIILKFFDTANQLPSYFNGFTSFLSVSFAWIPSYIWDIIAFGLLASITVMIVKVL